MIAGSHDSIIGYEKAGDLAPVWKMTPIRKPRATGLVFEHPSTNAARVVYWLDAQNRLTVESTLADTNAPMWNAIMPLAPLTGDCSLVITAPTNSFTLAATTNVNFIALRPITNMTQKVEISVK